MIEVQDIFNQYGQKYRATHKLPIHQLRAMSAIELCRTSALGGHLDECEECGHLRISYNSCRNRHCPKCQSLAKEKWLEDRKSDLLNIQYFHVVFTIPEELNPIALINNKVIYDILFKSTSEVLLELSEDKKYLGATPGFMTILHTWGQNLMFHPHVHCIVTGGGLSKNQDKWISSKTNFFIPVKVISKKFRGKFLYYLKKAYNENEIKFVGEIQELANKRIFKNLLDKLFDKKWVTFCKKPFKNAEYVLEYLGRYTHRVAISNNRIMKLENDKVTFKWRDYKDKSKEKLMTIDSEEFIRRFLMHILPSKFVKIRHYGILSNRNRSTKLKTCKKLVGCVIKDNGNSLKKLSLEDLILKLTGKDITICPCCNKGKMKNKRKLKPNSSPPIIKPKTA